MISAERRIKCLNVLIPHCSQINENRKLIIASGKEVPASILAGMSTILYSANDIGTEELVKFKAGAQKVYGDKTVQKLINDLANIHPVIRDNLKNIAPEEGMKVERLINLAKEENITFHISPAAQQVICSDLYPTQ